MPSYRCRDVGVDCNWEGKAFTRGGLLKKIAEHAKTVHNMATIPDDLMAKVKAAIK